MEIIITEWGLNTYLELKSENIFDDEEYRKIIRPDVLRLQNYPNDPKFELDKFWSPAQDRNGETITSGYKMKWHQIGNGRIQLRLTVGILGGKCFLCEAYKKSNDKVDKRKLARFKVYLQLIRQGRYTIRGKLA